MLVDRWVIWFSKVKATNQWSHPTLAVFYSLEMPHKPNLLIDPTLQFNLKALKPKRTIIWRSLIRKTFSNNDRNQVAA